MPWVEVTTRDPLTQETKAWLAGALATTMTTIEVGSATEAAKDIDWMWFRVLSREDWAVGGEFGPKYIRGRTMCLARIMAPEAYLNRELQIRAIAEVTKILREGLSTASDDDGSGIWVIFTEIPQDTWGTAGKPQSLSKTITAMDGDVSAERRTEMKAHFDGYDRMKEQFGIPQ